MPVVDREQRIVNIVTVDDVIDILQQETYLRLYPALMSVPFITTAIDVVGVLIYFNLARVILKL